MGGFVARLNPFPAWENSRYLRNSCNLNSKEEENV